VPFTHRNIKKDLEDIGARFDGAPDLEFRAATKPLELENAALSYQCVPPGYRFPYGHTHETQEEVYVVVRGSGRMNVDGEIVQLEEWDAVRVPPGAWRGYEAGPGGLEILVVGAPNLGDDPRGDVEGRRDWWADEPTASWSRPIETFEPRASRVTRTPSQRRRRRQGRDALGRRPGHQPVLGAGLLDELELHLVPILLGDGARLFDHLGDADVRLEQLRAVEAPGVTHVKYRVVR
jgi:quercetin dioxygenase-like cupin family protein